MNLKVHLIVLFLSSVCIYCQPVFAQPSAHIGSGLVFLEPASPGIEFVGRLSPDGSFVVGLSVTGNSLHTQGVLELWDLRTLDPNGALVRPKPILTLDLSVYADQYFDANRLIFSPDSRFLAMLLGNEMWLLNIPDLSLAKQLRVEGMQKGSLSASIHWSPDNHTLVVGYETGVAAWDIKSDTLTTITGDAVLSLQVFEDGWLIEKPEAFSFCDVAFQHCQSYAIEQPIGAVDQHHRLVVTGTFIDPNDQRPQVVWKQQPDGKFQIDQQMFADIKGKLTEFSPDGKYAALVEWSKGQNPDYPYFTLYDLVAREPLYELGIFAPTWLADTGYFVIGTSLYHPSVPEPVSQITSLAPVTDAEIGMYPETFPVRSFSDDGRWYLWVPGATAFVVPVLLNG